MARRVLGALPKAGKESNESEELQLLRRYRATQDAGARDRLVELFLPLAQALARRYGRGREPLEDLSQIAGMGLVKALDRFDPERGIAFTAFAVPTILGELKRYFRDSSRLIYLPQRIQENVVQIDRAAEELRIQLGRAPSAREIARTTGLSMRAVLEAGEAVIACDTLSLDGNRATNGHEDGASFADTVGYQDERYELIENMELIAPALKALTPRERLILHLRFVEDMTQAQIAGQIGLSQMHVSRLLRRSLARLRAVANASTEPPLGPSSNGAAKGSKGPSAVA